MSGAGHATIARILNAFGDGATVAGVSWRGGRLSAPEAAAGVSRLRCGRIRHVRRAWEGQALDIESGADLALALVRSGQWSPDMFVVGNSTGVIGRWISCERSAVPDRLCRLSLGLRSQVHLRHRRVMAAGATAVLAGPSRAGEVLRLLGRHRRAGSFQMKPLPIDLGRLRVDGIATRMWMDGVECLMPAMEHLLLRYLAERHGQIVSRDELVSVAWGSRDTIVSNSLAVHLGRVRRRFQAHSGVDWIRSVRGCGYQLVRPAPVCVRRCCGRRISRPAACVGPA